MTVSGLQLRKRTKSRQPPGFPLDVRKDWLQGFADLRRLYGQVARNKRRVCSQKRAD